MSILIVSYYFPPNAEVGGRRVARFCRYLPDFGIQPIVLTIDEGSCETLDRSFQTSVRIERVRPYATLLDWYHHRAARRMVRRVAAANFIERAREKHSFSLRRHILAVLQIPDIHRGWYRPAIKAAAQIVGTSHVDAVLSSGPPWTGHAIAHSFSRQHNIPWIADFRDGWASEPWRRYAFNSQGPPAWRDRLDWWIEDRWVRHASLTICTTTHQRDTLINAHQQADGDKVITIPNGLDRIEGTPSVGTARMGGPVILLHAGDLYGGRRIDGFCRAVGSLVRGGQLSPAAVRIILMGRVDENIEREARDSAPDLFNDGIIAFRPRVDWEKAQQALRQADALLIFQGDHPTAIPAKFYEYIQTGKPILGIVGEGALKDMVLRTGSGFVADPDDLAGIASAIKHALAAKPRNTDEVERMTRPFHFRSLTADLATHVRSAVGRHRGVQAQVYAATR